MLGGLGVAFCMRFVLLVVLALLGGGCSWMDSVMSHPVTSPAVVTCQIIAVTTIIRASGKVDTLGIAYRKTPFCRVPSDSTH